MILCDRDLLALLKGDQLVVSPFDVSHLGATSIDLRLGDSLVEYLDDQIVLGVAPQQLREFYIDEFEGYVVEPGGFILGATLERIRIPNGYQGMIEARSNIARAGLLIHNGVGHIAPGFDGSPTLEISNQNSIPIVIHRRVFICQLFVHTLSGETENLYRGKYSGLTKPAAYLP